MKSQMIRHTMIWMVLLSLFCKSVYGQNVEQDSALIKGELSNGLCYYLLHNDRTKGLADFYLVQLVGSIQEEEHERGLAHFLEHMAFKGTRHFPGRSLIAGLEQKGIRFGRNINAETSYDQTVYRLTDIPVHGTGLVDTALLILQDWSSGILIEDEAIEQERGIIREEWRTRSTALLRILEQDILPTVYAGTPYADRIPMGSMDVVSRVKPQVLRDFFHKWYRPDLQAIVIVGDMDMKALERQLIAGFSKIPGPGDPILLRDNRIPDRDKPIVAIGTDPELQDINLSIYWKLPEIRPEEKATIASYRQKLRQGMIAELLGRHFATSLRTSRQFFGRTTVRTGGFLISDRRQALSLNSTPVIIDSTARALEELLMEVKSFGQSGISMEALEKYRKELMQQLAYLYAERRSSTNASYVQRLLRHFTLQEPLLDPKWEETYRKAFFSSVTKEELNQELAGILQPGNMVITIMGPEQARHLLPTAEMLQQIVMK